MKNAFQSLLRNASRGGVHVDLGAAVRRKTGRVPVLLGVFYCVFTWEGYAVDSCFKREDVGFGAVFAFWSHAAQHEGDFWEH